MVYSYFFFSFFFSSTSLLLATYLPPRSCTHAQSCDPMDCSPPGSSVHGPFRERILEWVAISFSIVILFISSWFSLGKLYISGKFSISFRLSIYWHVLCGVVLDPVYFCGVGCDVLFTCNFIDLGLLSRWVWLKTYKFYLFKEPDLSFIDNFYFFLSLSFIYFFSDLYDFLLSTNFGFCFFSGSFRCKDRLLISDFSYLLR